VPRPISIIRYGGGALRLAVSPWKSMMIPKKTIMDNKIKAKGGTYGHCDYSLENRPLRQAHLALFVEGIGEVSPAKADKLDLRINSASGVEQDMLKQLGYNIPAEHSPKVRK
jgi:hypothetical protein